MAYEAHPDSVEKLSAFQTAPTTPSKGWHLYNPAAEFKRQGVGSSSKTWRISTINADYALIPTYPALLVEPAHISDATLTYAAKFRSKKRIPTLSYLHWANQGSITRCSQPMVGLKQNRSVQDEKLVEAIFATSCVNEQKNSGVYGSTMTNLIIDARPLSNAMANIAKGAGTENMDYYSHCKKVHLGVDNIHVMRDSLNRAALALRTDTRSALEHTYTTSVDQLALRRSNWLKHIGALLDGALLIVKNVHLHASHVLIHCSDGWDRTAQLTSLAALCLDPYYRTLEGFAVLIEKDWVSFGHRFQERSGLVGLGADKFDMAVPQNGPLFDAEGALLDDTLVEPQGSGSFWDFTKHLKVPFQAGAAQQRAPIFHQFLDCVCQLQSLYPDRFAFNGSFLAELLRLVYAGNTGTFLYNTEQERRRPRTNGAAPMDCTFSVWDKLFHPQVVEQWKNSRYNPARDDRQHPDGDMGVLMPSTSALRYSTDLFHRPYAELNSRLDSEIEEKRRLRERLSAASNEARAQSKGESADARDESFQAAATKMRSLITDGWGRVQNAWRSAGLDHAQGLTDSANPAGMGATELVEAGAVNFEAQPARGSEPSMPLPEQDNPWAELRTSIVHPPSPQLAAKPKAPPPHTLADPLGAWQV